jgi:site-specific recombinase XerD
MHPDSITLWLQRFSERHGLPHINPHAFRHTFASILISKGIDIVTVSKTLGHEKVSTTTDIYAELMKQASEEASQCIADVVLRKAK